MYNPALFIQLTVVSYTLCTKMVDLMVNAIITSKRRETTFTDDGYV